MNKRVKLTCFACFNFILATLFTGFSLCVQAWEMQGEKSITAYTQDNQKIKLGTVSFTPAGDKSSIKFKLNLDRKPFTDYFLSMREFKCLNNAKEVVCHVPYPYSNPQTVTNSDMAWLEHSLLFFYKLPRDFGARLWNGLYFQFKKTDSGLVGHPQAIDLNAISAPPEDPSIPPFPATERSEISKDARWIKKLVIH